MQPIGLQIRASPPGVLSGAPARAEVGRVTIRHSPARVRGRLLATDGVCASPAVQPTQRDAALMPYRSQDPYRWRIGALPTVGPQRSRSHQVAGRYTDSIAGRFLMTEISEDLCPYPGGQSLLAASAGED